MPNSLESKLAHLKESIPAFQKIWLATQKADNGNVFPMDLYTTAVTHRAMCIISGFCIMIENQNFICAAPLVRLHLDNLLRLYAALLVGDLHEFCLKVLEGEHVRNLKDRNNQKMTDKYLVKKISDEYSWVTRLYEETSGYVHLSHKHHFNTVNHIDEKEGSVEVEFGIGVSDINIPAGIREEAADAMIEITQTLLKYLHGWAYTKANPEEVQRMRAIAQK